MITDMTWQQSIVAVTTIIAVAAVLILKGDSQIIAAVVGIIGHAVAPSLLGFGKGTT